MARPIGLGLLTIVALWGVACGSGGFEEFTSENARELLTVEEVRTALSISEPLQLVFTDNEAELPLSDVRDGGFGKLNLNSRFTLRFQTEDGSKAIEMQAIHFISLRTVGRYVIYLGDDIGLEKILEDAEDALGHSVLGKDFETNGVQSAGMAFAKGEKLIRFSTETLEGEEPLTDLNGLIKLAETVEPRVAE